MKTDHEIFNYSDIEQIANSFANPEKVKHELNVLCSDNFLKNNLVQEVEYLLIGKGFKKAK